MPGKLHIELFCLGDWLTNCYVVHAEGGSACWIVDAGYEPEPMLDYIESHQLTPERVVLTHAHVDHIAGLGAVRAKWPEIPILVHEAEVDFLVKPRLNMSLLLPYHVKGPAATGTLKHGQVLTLDGFDFEVRHTPGHSPGGVSLYQQESSLVFAGDALFAGSVGRTDFFTSEKEALVESIRTQLYTLPDETRVLTGHGSETTIGEERAHNPFVPGVSG